MNDSMRDRLADVHPQMLRASSERPARAGESDCKKVADLRTVIGRLVERALEIAGVRKQEAAFQMGYSDQGTVSRWCSGVERPLFDKLFMVEGFEDAWMLALAERNPQMEVETRILVRRRA